MRAKKTLEGSLNDHPRQLSDLIHQVDKEFSIGISRFTLCKVFKSIRYVWKEVRKSLKSKRDHMAFEPFQIRLRSWQKQADKGQLDLFYYYEAGFNLTPCVPYA